jgi:hypothetical protein
LVVFDNNLQIDKQLMVFDNSLVDNSIINL